jgi:hypothetical protein
MVDAIAKGTTMNVAYGSKRRMAFDSPEVRKTASERVLPSISVFAPCSRRLGSFAGAATKITKKNTRDTVRKAKMETMISKKLNKYGRDKLLSGVPTPGAWKKMILSMEKQSRPTTRIETARFQWPQRTAIGNSASAAIENVSQTFRGASTAAANWTIFCWVLVSSIDLLP